MMNYLKIGRNYLMKKKKWLFEYADLELQGYRIIDYKLVKLDEEFEIQKEDHLKEFYKVKQVCLKQ